VVDHDILLTFPHKTPGDEACEAWSSLQNPRLFLNDLTHSAARCSVPAAGDFSGPYWNQTSIHCNWINILMEHSLNIKSHELHLWWLHFSVKMGRKASSSEDGVLHRLWADLFLGPTHWSAKAYESGIQGIPNLDGSRWLLTKRGKHLHLSGSAMFLAIHCWDGIEKITPFLTPN
jgi:hypothetical protein